MQLLFALVLIFVCGFGNQVWAAATVTLTQTQKLTFPTLVIPSSGTINLTISQLNSSTSGTGQIIAGTARRGAYNLSSSGGGSTSITISISGITTSHAGLTMSAFRGLYNTTTINSFPSTTLPLPAKRPKTTPLYLGSTITANSSVTPGLHTASFTVTIFIQ